MLVSPEIIQIHFGLGATKNLHDSAPLLLNDLTSEIATASSKEKPDTFMGLPTGLCAVDALHDDADEVQNYLKEGLKSSSYAQLSNVFYLNEIVAHISEASLTNDGFFERLIFLWSNHFSVNICQGGVKALIGPFIREAIRPNVTGHFSDLVLAAERHPAMLRYLSNDNSIGPKSPAGRASHRGLNENLGRECMELHTVGLKAGYTQADVIAMAKILTGWSVADATHRGDSTGFFFREDFHEPGPQTVMGQVFDAPGEQQGIDALKFLATRPATYDHIATKLVRHFVSDNPPPHCVAKIAGVLKDTGGHLGAASAALVDLPEAWVPLTKFKTPMELMISAIRACPPGPDDPVIDYRGTLAQLGQPLWGAPLPNGWPDQASAWDSSDQMIARVNWAYTYSARFESGPAGVQPADIAHIALGPLLRPETRRAMAQAGSRREAMTLLFTAPEFQRR